MAASKYKRQVQALEDYSNRWHLQLGVLLEALSVVTDHIRNNDHGTELPPAHAALVEVLMCEIDKHMASFDPRAARSHSQVSRETTVSS